MKTITAKSFGRESGILLIWVSAMMLAPPSAAAQRWQLDLSATQVEFDTAAALTAGSVAPLVEWNRDRLYATAGGNFTVFQSSQWASQGWGNLSLLSSRFGSTPLRAEILGGASGSVHSNSFRTATTRGEFRTHVSGRQGGVWLGGAGATGWTSVRTDVATALGPTAGVWARHATSSLAVTFSPFQFEGHWFPEAQGYVSISAGSLELTGYAGWRGAPAESEIAPSSWAGAAAALWLTGEVALVVSGGGYSADLLQALPGGRYISAAVRLTDRRRPVVNVKPRGSPVYEAERAEGTLIFEVPGARRVDVVGDWTGWQPVPMRLARDGRWVLDAPLPPGVHRFNLVVDGDRWIVPDGVTDVDDGFGGRAGLLIVSG